MERVIRPYTVEWIEMFTRIAEYLRKHCTAYLGIEHVGSTSIPGMAAKPIIDIDMVIVSRADFHVIKTELEAVGYHYVGDQGIPGREVFDRWGDGISLLDEIPHHLYVCTKDNLEYNRHIRFRDRLRADPGLVAEYNSIKNRILAAVGDDNRAGYVAMKETQYTEFFERVLRDL
ncbi:GrpB family protein [Spirochaeta lutea]|uniref:GrpB family protein n=1 Tax=Spirochaeta lutea TaxID=1480694 RepID=UPI00068C57D2|nr:GrpB family protein [Spirochaeta lutea]